jgi:hypothetical protein
MACDAKWVTSFRLETFKTQGLVEFLAVLGPDLPIEASYQLQKEQLRFPLWLIAES